MLHDLDLYKEYYEKSKRADAQWALIFSDDPTEISKLEDVLLRTQSASVDDLIDGSNWSDDLPHFFEKKGTPAEQLHGLRFAYLFRNSRLNPMTEYRFLTPLEHDLFELVRDMAKTCADFKMKKRARAVMKDAGRIADRAKRRWWKEMEVQREKEDVPFGAAIDATGAQTLEEFADIVEKTSPEIAESLRHDIAADKKKKAAAKRVKK